MGENPEPVEKLIAGFLLRPEIMTGELTQSRRFRPFQFLSGNGSLVTSTVSTFSGERDSVNMKRKSSTISTNEFMNHNKVM
jgi:hypothetical protein